MAASRSRLVNCASARASPTTMIAASTARRRKRRRVSTHRAELGAADRLGQLARAPAHQRGARSRRAASATSSVSPAAIQRSDAESAATMRAAMAGEGIPSAVLLDALGTLVELETPVAAPGRRARRARRGGRRGGRARGDARRDGLLPRPPRRGARLGRRCATCAGAARRSSRTSWARRCRWPTSRTRCWRRCASAPIPRCPPCSRACARAARAWPSSATGTSRCTTCSSAPGLRALVDAVVISAEQGAAKPDPAIFRAALERLGAAADDAMHVGDSVEPDVEGARAAGLEADPRRPRRRGGARRRARRRVARRAVDDVGHNVRLVLCIEHRMSTAPSSVPPPPFGRRSRAARRRRAPAAAARPALEAVDGVGRRWSPPSAARSSGR